MQTKYKLILYTALLFTVVSLNAQIKEGLITYSMKIEGLTPEQAKKAGEMETKITFKNGKTLTEVQTIYYSTVILNDDNGSLNLWDQMGYKMAVKQTKEELEKEAIEQKNKLGDPNIEYTNETKTIAGYECKKAIVTVLNKDKKNEKIEVWICDKFENTNKEGKGQGQGFMRGLKEMPFEYITKAMANAKMTISVKSVSLDPIDDSKFNLSTEGYKMMTSEELKAMRGESK
jgi:translation initiation factor 2B subunit (eIF-2B alpha/beta/delta family)